MLRDLLKEDLIGKYFNEKTLQVAYHKHQYGHLEPGDHGYMKGMNGFHDLENDLCICRHFDNSTTQLRNKGFKAIVPDDIPNVVSYRMVFNPDYHIKESEVRKLLNLAQRADKIAKLSGKIYIKETKGKQPKVLATNFINKQEEKKESLMKDVLVFVNKLKKEKDKDKIVELVFDIGTILKKNLFTLEDLKNKVKK